jgi:hypothetical protein
MHVNRYVFQPKGTEAETENRKLITIFNPAFSGP